MDKRLGLDALIERHLTDPRTGHNRQFPLLDLFRQSIYSRLAGYEDTNDTERLAEDACCSGSSPTTSRSATPARPPLAIQGWSLSSLRQRLFKTGGRLIRHARYFVLQLAESRLTGILFRQIVARIERLAWHPT